MLKKKPQYIPIMYSINKQRKAKNSNMLLMLYHCK